MLPAVEMAVSLSWVVFVVGAVCVSVDLRRRCVRGVVPWCRSGCAVVVRCHFVARCLRARRRCGFDDRVLPDCIAVDKVRAVPVCPLQPCCPSCSTCLDDGSGVFGMDFDVVVGRPGVHSGGSRSRALGFRIGLRRTIRHLPPSRNNLPPLSHARYVMPMMCCANPAESSQGAYRSSTHVEN
jgi:hypothetical protein